MNEIYCSFTYNSKVSKTIVRFPRANLNAERYTFSIGLSMQTQQPHIHTKLIFSTMWRDIRAENVTMQFSYYIDAQNSIQLDDSIHSSSLFSLLLSLYQCYKLKNTTKP